MAIIPVANETVKMQAPTVPEYNIPNAVPGAFGEKTAEAIGNVGNAISGVGDIVAKYEEQQAKEKAASVKTEYMQKMQDLMYNPEEETYTDGDKTLTRPKGLMMQYGSQTKGAMQRMQPQEAELRKAAIDQVPNFLKGDLNASLESHFLSTRENLLQHEHTQTRIAAHNTYGATRKTLVDQAAMAKDKDSLIGFFNNINKNNADEVNRFGLGDAALVEQNNKDYATAAGNAAASILTTTGDVKQAKKMLSDVKEYILPDTFNDINQKIDTMDKVRKENYRRQDAMNEFAQTAAVVKGIASGGIDLTDPNAAIKLSGKNTKLGTAITAIQQDKGKYATEKEENKAFEKYAKSIFDSDSQEKINDLLIDALNAMGNKEISQDKLNIIVNAALGRAKTLKLDSKSAPVNSDPKQIEINGYVNAITRNTNPRFSTGDALVNFFKGVNDGKPSQDAYTDAIKTELTRNNPLMTKHKVGDIVTNSKGESAEVIGFNENGSPIIKKRISGKTNTTK
jgi:hypothetical protein